MHLIARLFVPLGLIGFSVIYFIEAGQIRSIYDTGPIRSGDYPKFLAVALAVAVVVAVALDFRKAHKAERVEWGGVGLAFLVIATCAVYLLLFQFVGYFVSTILFTLALLAIFSRLEMSIPRTILEAVVLTAVVYGLFAVVFEVRLPAFPSFGGATPPAVEAPQ
ncbi:tripartite tricarboxylate transporter TctB family protein [Acuticoccus sp. M5D2P5]|uniref:tripartite tricarboxylate transporter TctB family protein n=1 Tax=Acuticoccus kalidii TaxID=2910977 RepID=UPI001F1ED152|nr:tripartite tricarboxylate transporter TctB family protein [Acuticoccus kalidii]MCF3935362.1 tripartite tricarboxylate transporter TctB family protein [Acuticoccus kalidii]